jgi:hypothetical protein
VTATGYNDKEVRFELSQRDGSKYPEVYMTKKSLNFLTGIGQLTQSFNEMTTDLVRTLRSLSVSIQYFELNSLLVMTLFVLLTAISFAERVKVPLWSLAHHILHRIRSSLDLETTGRFEARVCDKDTGKSIVGASVFLIDAANQHVIDHTITGQHGHFSFKKDLAKTYLIELLIDGQEPMRYAEDEVEEHGEDGYVLVVQRQEGIVALQRTIRSFAGRIVEFSFETLLIISIIGEVLLGLAFGWSKMLVFLAISLANLILWLMHLSHEKAQGRR